MPPKRRAGTDDSYEYPPPRCKTPTKSKPLLAIAVPEPEPEPEPDGATLADWVQAFGPAPESGWGDTLELAASCAAGTCVAGLTVFGLRSSYHLLSRDVLVVSSASLWCLCGAAAVGAACSADKPTALEARLEHVLQQHGGELDWLSTLVAQLWPHVNKCAVLMKDEQFEPMLQQTLSSMRYCKTQNTAFSW